jgi:acetylglutamate kinase
VAEVRSSDLGLVGRIVGVNRDALELLCEDGFVPVLSPIATGPSGPLNTNADEAAQAVATALGAHGLLLLSDVDGVNGPNGRVAHATPESIEALKASGAATGGMLPKLQACAEAVTQGVAMVRIVTSDASLLQALDPASDLGTLVTHHGL